ncbi:MAG: MFS transporter [Bacteroidota bacterium]
MTETTKPSLPEKRNSGPWKWVPSLYFAEGVPYVLVNTLAVIFYKRMGISNTDIALYTSWLYLPWVIKWLWGPMIDMLKTKRFWILIMQLFIGVGLAGVAFTIPLDRFFQYTLAFLWLLAFSSATHDIAADGYYMLALSKHDQAFFVGVRSTFYRLAMLTGQGLLVIIAGAFESRTGMPPVELQVEAVMVDSVGEFNFAPGEIPVHEEAASLSFISPEIVQIPLATMEGSRSEILLDSMDAWNIRHEFYLVDEEDDDKDKNGWWKKNVAVPLGQFIKHKFGEDEQEVAESSGNLGFTWFYLSHKPEPGETVVLNFSFNKGDKSIKLAREYRFEFTEQNWNIPAVAAIQLDSKLDKESSASFAGLSGNIRFAWTMVFIIVAILFAAFHIYHRFALPRSPDDKPNISGDSGYLKEFFITYAEFFKKKRIGVVILFLLVYRLGESQLVKLASPFLLDSSEANGLGLTTGELGLIYGTVGIIALSAGGIIGGIVASRRGLKYWLWWMVAAMNLPNLVYVFLSYTMPESLYIVGASVVVEQFGYGFGFTAYMLYMIYVSEGKHKTAHFALTTGFMAFGMMIPGMLSGWLQEMIGYQHFFIWVMLCTIPSFLIIPFLKIDPGFGKKEK